MKHKHIVIDGRFWGRAGPGRYAKALVEHLEKIDKKNRYSILLNKDGFNLYKPTNPNFRKVLADYKWYSFKEQIFLPLKIISLKPDLYYVPHFNLPILYPKKVITAIPDIIMHKFSTNKATTLNSPMFIIKKIAYHATVLNAVLRSKKIIVPTNDVKNDFLSHYPFTKKDKYIVAPEGVDPDFTIPTTPSFEQTVLNKIGVKANFILFVSSMYRHKNPLKLVDAFKLLLEKYDYKGQLVMVGKKDYFSGKVSEYVEHLRLEGKVLLPGQTKYVSDKEIVALRRNTELAIIPSLKEGFSLTPLEAQVLGVPCAVSDIPCHKEVYGESVEYFDPEDAEDIAKKILLILQNPKKQKALINLGYKRVKMYSWEKTAKTTLRAFNDVLDN